MWQKLIIALAATTLLNACALRTRSAVAPTDWSAVEALSAGEQVEVVTVDGRRVSGTLTAVDADQIIVGPASVILRRTNVTAVWTIPREDSLFNGYVVGAITGAAVGAVGRKGNQAMAIPALTAAVGSAVGAWIDRGWKFGRLRKLVYRI